MESKPAFTIVTVCLNEKDSVGQTLDSIFAQECRNLEVVVVDGGSIDGTVEVLKEYKEKFLNNNIQFILISEKDSGIYDAMNKGIGIAKGEMICFLNAGDKFIDNRVLSNVLPLCNEHTSVIYGDTLRVRLVGGRELYKLQKPFDMERIRTGMPFCHQSSFVKNSIAKELRFNDKYTIAADYDMFARIYNSNETFVYAPFPVAVFYENGISENNYVLRTEERYAVSLRNGFCSEDEYNSAVKSIKMLPGESGIKKAIKKILPKSLINRRHINWLKSQGYSENISVVTNVVNH